MSEKPKRSGTLHTIEWGNPYTSPPAGAPRILAECFTFERYPPDAFCQIKFTLGGGYSHVTRHVAPPPSSVPQETLARIRRQRLARRVNAKTPMFAEHFIEQALEQKPEFYSGITDPQLQTARDKVLENEWERYYVLMSRPGEVIVYADEPRECRDRAAHLLEQIRVIRRNQWKDKSLTPATS